MFEIFSILKTSYAPWLSEIFYQKYSENQKLATHNMLRPSSVAFSDSFPPGGSLYQRQRFTFQTVSNNPLRNGRCPPRGEAFIKGIDLHFKLFATIRYETGDARPRGGSLYQRHRFAFQTVSINPLRNGRCPPPGGSLYQRQ